MPHQTDALGKIFGRSLDWERRCHMRIRRDRWYRNYEDTATIWRTFNDNVTTMLLHDLLANGKSQTGAAIAFVRLEDSENLLGRSRIDDYSVVTDGNAESFLILIS